MDYYVGCPAGLTLKDPAGISTNAALPFYKSSGGDHTIFVRGASPTIDGYNFAAGGGWQIWVYPSVSGLFTLRNCNFKQDAVAPWDMLVFQGSVNGDVLIEHNTFDYNFQGKLTGGANQISLGVGNGHTCTVQYNWVKNSGGDWFDFGGGASTAPCKFTFQFNLMENAGLSPNAHADWFAPPAGAFVNPFIIAYNLMIQNHPNGSAQGIGWGCGYANHSTTWNFNVVGQLHNNVMGPGIGMNLLLSRSNPESVDVSNNYIDPTGFGSLVSVNPPSITAPQCSGTFTQSNNINLLTGLAMTL